MPVLHPQVCSAFSVTLHGDSSRPHLRAIEIIRAHVQGGSILLSDLETRDTELTSDVWAIVTVNAKVRHSHEGLEVHDWLEPKCQQLC